MLDTEEADTSVSSGYLEFTEYIHDRHCEERIRNEAISQLLELTPAQLLSVINGLIISRTFCNRSSPNDSPTGAFEGRSIGDMVLHTGFRPEWCNRG